MKITKMVKDQTCPLCGFPETLLVVEMINVKGKNFDLGRALRFECSKRECNWEEEIEE